jgi:hypothetical protein
LPTGRQPRGLKAALIACLRGAEAPLFHGWYAHPWYARKSCLLRLRGRSLRRWSCRRLRLDRLRLEALNHRGRAAALGGVNRQRNRREHERYCRPGGGFGERAGRAARTECGLAALSAESSGNVAALAALQQDDNDDEETDKNVDGYDQTVNHVYAFS